MKYNSHERRETLARMSHDCRETPARISHDCRETLAQMSHDCCTVVRCSHECLMNVTAMRKLSKSRIYIAELCLQLVAKLSHPNEILAVKHQQPIKKRTTCISLSVLICKDNALFIIVFFIFLIMSCT